MKRLVLLRREREREKNYNSYTLVSLDVARILHISNPEKIENRIERWSFLTTTWQTIVPSLLLFSWTSARVIPSPRKKIKSSVRSGTINVDFPFQFSETRERVGGGVRPPPSPPHPCTFRVQGEREGKVVGVSIRERRRRRVLAHGTVIELGKEVLAKRSDDTPRCSRFSVHESGGNLRVMLFIRVPPVALYSRWRERTKRVARDKMRLAPRRERRISSSPSPFLPAPLSFPRRRADEAKKETTDDRHRLFTHVANESSFSSADTSANRATRIFDFHGREGKGHLPNSHVVRNASRMSRFRTGFRRLVFSHRARYLIDCSLRFHDRLPRNDFECSFFFCLSVHR